MTGTQQSRSTTLAPVVLSVVLCGQGITFVVFAMLHAGVNLPGIDQPAIVPAAFAESLCALATLSAGVAVLTRRAWAPAAAILGQSLAIVGVLAGIVSQIGDPSVTQLNFVYLRIMLAVLIAGVAAVLVPSVRRAMTAAQPARADRPAHAPE